MPRASRVRAARNVNPPPPPPRALRHAVAHAAHPLAPPAAQRARQSAGHRAAHLTESAASDSSAAKKVLKIEANDDVKIFHHDTNNELAYRNTIMSARTKDFVSFYTMPGQFVMYTADNDDGMKWHFYNLDTTSSFGIEFIEWTPYGGSEIYTPGKPMGIDSDGSSYIIMAIDQLGIELFSIDSLGSAPQLVSRIDTEGNAEKVTLVTDGVYAACDDAGAVYIPIESFSSDNMSYPFAEDMTVDHIAIKGNIASLTLGSKGIALYDVSDPTSPEEKGIFPVGYSYRTVFWGDKLLVCTREGLQVITIEQ